MSRYNAVLILTVALAAPLSAQRIERSHVAVRSPDAVQLSRPTRHSVPVRVAQSDSVDPVAAMLVSGLALGAVGMFGGGYLGYQIETAGGCGDAFFCGLAGAILGGLIGESVGMATGIHLAGGSRNSFAGDLGVALGIAALGTIAAPVTYGISLLAVPVVQLVVGTHRENKADRK